MANKSIYIPQIDGKDAFLGNTYCKESAGNNDVGYSVRSSDGRINTKRFRAVLDYSLERMQLQSIYTDVYRRRSMSVRVGKKEYTQYVVSVTFKYSIKEYNKLNRNVYVRHGYCYLDIADKMQDCACVLNGVLVGIQTNMPVDNPLPRAVLDKHFHFEDGVYKSSGSFPPVYGVDDIRKHLYENGFNLDGIHFVRYKRSSGSSRVGKCLFIAEPLYARIHKWEMCGLRIRENDMVDLAALESYISLSLSSIVDTMVIRPENILVIDDYESVFRDNVAIVEEKNGSLVTREGETEIRNSIWDGQSLIDVSMMGKYADKGFVLLRNRFFKSAAFNCNLQQWFKDHSITDVSQLNGQTLAKRIEDVKYIVTPSSIKYLKFGSLDGWLDHIDPLFGVVKHEKETHFFDGRFVQVHYQLLNTLQMSEADVAEFLKPSLDYLYMLKTDPSVLRYHIHYKHAEFDDAPADTKNEIVYKLLGINDAFCRTKLFVDFKNDLIKSYVRNMRNGHILVEGNYSVMCGNPIEMLHATIHAFDGRSILGIGNVHSTRFANGEQLLGSRSPHVTIANVLLANNVWNEDVSRYMNLSNEIVCVNSIGENLLSRLSGAD